MGEYFIIGDKETSELERNVRFLTTHFYCNLIGAPFERKEYGVLYIHQTIFVPKAADATRRGNRTDMLNSFRALEEPVREEVIDFFCGSGIKRNDKIYNTIVELVGEDWAGEGTFTGIFSEVDEEGYVFVADWVSCLPVAELLRYLV